PGTTRSCGSRSSSACASSSSSPHRLWRRPPRPGRSTGRSARASARPTTPRSSSTTRSEHRPLGRRPGVSLTFRHPRATSASKPWTSPRSSGEVESGARKVTRMSATVRELVDEAYDRRESTWRAALETVNDWVESVLAPSALLSGDRVRVVEGRIKDRMRTGEKLRRKLADANDDIHESVEVENQVIDVVGARAVCRTEREQTALWDLLNEGDDTNLSID